jgi:hypothetical protein
MAGSRAHNAAFQIVVQIGTSMEIIYQLYILMYYTTAYVSSCSPLAYVIACLHSIRYPISTITHNLHLHLHDPVGICGSIFKLERRAKLNLYFELGRVSPAYDFPRKHMQGAIWQLAHMILSMRRLEVGFGSTP